MFNEIYEKLMKKFGNRTILKEILFKNISFISEIKNFIEEEGKKLVHLNFLHTRKLQLEKKCIICDNDAWLDVDYLRRQPQKMIVCNNCGFVTFNRFNNPIDYEDYYENEYRQSTVNVNNLVTTNRKLGYHEVFIGEYLKKEKNLSICDLGAGIGYFLNWAKHKYYHKNVTGVELDLHMRRFAYNNFNLTLTSHFDEAKTYDFVAIYHTLEHFPDPAGELEKVKKCLNPGGKVYIAVPVWMEEMMNHGGAPFDTFDNHFHENHLNAWSKKQFQHFLARNGWNIIKEHHKLYGYTVLVEPIILKRDEFVINKNHISDGPHTKSEAYKDGKDIEYQLQTMQKAATAYSKGQTQEAIRLYPKFVDAYLTESGKQQGNFNIQLKLIQAGERECPNSNAFTMQRALLYYQRDMLEQAMVELTKALSFKPFDENLLLHKGLINMRIGEEIREKDPKKSKELSLTACKIFSQITDINPTRYAEAWNYLAYVLSKMPLSNEKDIKFTQPGTEGSAQVALNNPAAGI